MSPQSRRAVSGSTRAARKAAGGGVPVTDLAVKVALCAAVAALVTRRISHASAADAHRWWVAVLFSPVAVLLANTAAPPVAYLVPRAEIASIVGSRGGAGVLWLYAAVAAVLLLRLALGLWSVSRLVRAATPLRGDDLAMVRRLSQVRNLDVRESQLSVPVTAGPLRSCVLLPRGWRSLSPAALTAILRHEAAHVRRRDCTQAVCAALLQAAFWFHPAVWLAGARMRWFAELACDAEAAGGMPPGDYASELLRLSAAWAGIRTPRQAITAGAETHVAARIRLLIDGVGTTDRGGRVLAFALLLMIPAIAASGLIRFSLARDLPARADFDHGGSHAHGPHSAFSIQH